MSGDNTNSFDLFVIRSILANNPFGIEKINFLESLSSRFFVKDEYPEIESLIFKGNIQAIKSLPSNKSQEREYLEVMIFKDQNQKEYIVTVYDSNELSQDPQVIEIYSLYQKSL